jgi:molecular chaperone GrpE (heat shock protein)
MTVDVDEVLGDAPALDDDLLERIESLTDAQRAEVAAMTASEANEYLAKLGAAEPQDPQPEATPAPEAKPAAKDGKQDVPGDSSGQPDSEADDSGKHRGLHKEMARMARALQRLQAERDELRAQVKQGGTQAATPAQQAQADALAEQAGDLEQALAAIADDSPELAGLVRNLVATVQQTTAQVQELRSATAPVVKQVADTAEAAFEDALAQAPDLALWVTLEDDAGKALVAEATAIEDRLLQSPHWAAKSQAERFQKVVEMVRDIYPDAPTAVKPEPKTEPQPQPKQQATADLKAVAQKALQKAQARPAVASLTDVPGTPGPTGSATDQARQVSAAAMADMFAKMTPEQVDAYLAANTPRS